MPGWGGGDAPAWLFSKKREQKAETSPTCKLRFVRPTRRKVRTTSNMRDLKPRPGESMADGKQVAKHS